MHVVEQVDFRAELPPQALEQRRHGIEIPFAAPARLGQCASFGRLVPVTAADAVSLVHTRHGALDANRLVALRYVPRRGFDRSPDGLTARMTVDHYRVA